MTKLNEYLQSINKWPEERVIKRGFYGDDFGEGFNQCLEELGAIEIPEPKSSHACTCQRHPDSCFTVKLVNGLAICPRCSGVVVPVSKKVKYPEKVNIPDYLNVNCADYKAAKAWNTAIEECKRLNGNEGV